ncbi:MAG: GNAT family protein [Ferruginibacter sp.]
MEDTFSFRLLSKGDEESFFQLVDSNRGRLENFFAGTVARNKDLSETTLFVSDVLEKIANNIYFPFVIIENELEKIVGYIDVKNIDWNIPKGELGFFIDQNFEGKGIVKKILSKVIRHCMDDMKFNKLFLRTHELNAGTRHVAEKNGFKVEGIIRNDYRTTDGKLVDLIYYGLVREANS